MNIFKFDYIESLMYRSIVKVYNLSVLLYKFPKIKREIPEIEKQLMNNKQYENLYTGKRCFVLGNGPSLKQENLALLKKEFVFTVNQAVRLEQFKDLRSNFHFWADSNFFNIDLDKDEDCELFNVMKAVSQYNPDMQCFFPIQQKYFIEKYNLNAFLNVNYYYTDMKMYDRFNENFDYSRPTFAFHTVVQWCISMAIYMGFSEIYLLGCDCTSIRSTVNSILHQNNSDDYAYDISKNEKVRLEKTVGSLDLELTMGSCLHVLQDYRRLYEYCEKRNIKLVNCSSETVLTSIPRASLSDVLAGNA